MCKCPIKVNDNRVHATFMFVIKCLVRILKNTELKKSLALDSLQNLFVTCTQLAKKLKAFGTLSYLTIHMEKKVREHLLCYEGKLLTYLFLQSKSVLTKLFS